MRTTLTLDPDVTALLREELERTRLPLKSIVNRAIRLGLRRAPGAEEVAPYRTRPHSFGLRPGFDIDRASQIADELETLEFANGLRSQQ